jgi:hypothetical protein
MGVVDLGVTAAGDLVAIKTLRAGSIGGADGRARFEREIAAMQRVRGPRVAEVIDADAAADPPYVVTRYVRGIPLSKVIADHGPLRGEALHRFAAGLAEALSSVHAAGIVHRDIKPANVIVTDDGPILIDFGLAHAVGDARLTEVGMITGTPGYLAPETAYGHEASFATDIHGWAATVGFAAVGSSPYGEGHDTVVLDRIRRGAHEVKGLPEPLANLVLRSLRVDPRSRPSLADIGTALGVESTIVFVPQPPPEPTAAVSNSALSGAPDTEETGPADAVSVSTAETHVVAAPATAAHEVPTASPPRRPSWMAVWLRSLQPRFAVVSAAFALVFLGCLWPHIAIAALFVIILVGRSTWRIYSRLHTRRAASGPRRSDQVVVGLAAPLDVGLSVLPATVQTVLIGSAGYLAGAALNLVDLQVPGWELVPILTGSVIALVLAWSGPGAEKCRYGWERLAAPLANAHRVAWGLSALFVAAGWTFVLLWDRWGTTWVPFDAPLNPFA